MKGVTSYSGISQFYFKHLLRTIIRVGRLTRPAISILDFGCGKGELKRMLPSANVIGFDIIPALSDVSDWRSVDFDVLVANEVFYSFTEEELTALLQALREKNKDLVIVVGISRQGLLNKLGKYLFGKPDAHSATKIGPKKEKDILQRFCRINRKTNVFYLADVYVLTFR